MDTEEIDNLHAELMSKVSQLGRNIVGLFEEGNCEIEVGRLSGSIGVLRANLNHLSYFINNAAKRNRGGNEKGGVAEVDSVREKYIRLQKEWDCQQEHLGKVQAELYRSRSQLRAQSAFCASLGAVIGNLLWKSSRLQPVVDLLLTTKKLSEFFCLASGTLVSFMETFSKEMPNVKSDETQFILSMGGIIANIAAVPEGRHFLVSDNNGKELIQLIVQSLPNIPSPSGHPLTRILLMVLYNVSINQGGLVMLQDEKSLLRALSKCIEGVDTNSDLQLLSLRLLESITSEICTIAVLKHIYQFIPMGKLVELREKGAGEAKEYACNALGNIEKAEGLFGGRENLPPYTLYQPVLPKTK